MRVRIHWNKLYRGVTSLPFGFLSVAPVLPLWCQGHILTPPHLPQKSPICHKKVTMRAKIGATAALQMTESRAGFSYRLLFCSLFWRQQINSFVSHSGIFTKNIQKGWEWISYPQTSRLSGFRFKSQLCLKDFSHTHAKSDDGGPTICAYRRS